MKKAPCVRDCPGRTMTCHDTCEKYLAWREQSREERNALARDTAMGKAVEDLHAASIKRTKRGRIRG